MLPKTLQRIIENRVKKAFSSLRMNLLGPDKVSGQFLFSLRTFDPKTTLTHLYSHANAVNDLTPGRTDKQALDKVRDLAEKYIDSLEQKTIADTTRIVANKLEDAATEAKIQGIEPSDYLRQEDGKKILSSIEKELQEQRKKINKATELLVNHELHTSQNLGAFDGILSAAKSIGVDDPVIFKIGVLDENRCLAAGQEVVLRGGTLEKVENLKIGDILRSHKNLSGLKDRSINLNSVVTSIKKDIKPCIEIEFDNGEKLRCTEDHPILIYYNNIYIFWPAAEVVKLSNVEVVDIHKLSVKDKKKLSFNLKPILATKNGYPDFWTFCQSESDKICQLYEDGLSIVKICREYNSDPKSAKLISVILKLKKVFNPQKHKKGNKFNKRYIDKKMKFLQQKVLNLTEKLVADMKSGLSGTEISRKYGISRSLFGKFLKTVNQDVYNQWLRSLKAKGALAAWENLQKDPDKLKEIINKTRQRFATTSLKGSRPQQELANRLKSCGFDVEYNKSINENMRVDMIVNNCIVVEYDGSGHDMAVRMGLTTQPKLSKKDYARDVVCKEMGYKVIRIKSKNDRVPTIDVLKNLITKVQENPNSYFEVRCED